MEYEELHRKLSVIDKEFKELWNQFKNKKFQSMESAELLTLSFDFFAIESKAHLLADWLEDDAINRKQEEEAY